LIIGKKYDATTSSVRKLAHTFANDFIKAVTGKDSFFLAPIVVGIDNGPSSNRDIYVADWDGRNARAVTDHKTITVSPAWSRSGEYIAYTAFVKRKIGKGPSIRNADMFIYELKTKRRWLVSYRTGMNSGAEFLHDSRGLLLTLSQGQTADIYRMGLDGKNLVQITKGPGLAMNVEPAVSPDGSTIAFSSDRSGKPMIYLMNPTGGNIRRITFAGHYNSTPSWAPDGKKLAFAGFDKDKGNFDIFIVNTSGDGLMRLSSAKKPNGRWANNEDPAVSPDGRHVLFVSDRTGTKQLYMVNTDGTNERRITFDNKFYSKPKWGPIQN
jgi:TolB protein